MDRQTPPLRPGGVWQKIGQDSTPVSYSVQPLPPRSKRPEITRPFGARTSNEDRPSVASKPRFEGLVENVIIEKLCKGKENVCPPKNQLLGVYNRAERPMQVCMMQP